MAGLYVHIPFCRSRCIYCGFYSTTALDLRQRYVDALCREWQLRRQEMTAPLDTIYLGGGTPSQLLPAQLQQLFDALPSAGAEVTMEVNPDDVTALFAGALSRLPITRISMGAQTFDDRRLRFLHRRHSAAQVSQAVRLLRDAGIRNISIDLMYGFPQETLDDWLYDIDAALALDVEHLSAYCLMVEEGTELEEKIKNRSENIEMPDEETERRMYYALIDRLTAAGYEHYEISNFARRGRRSLHNSSYWHDVPYIGLGAAAHSYLPSATVLGDFAAAPPATVLGDFAAASPATVLGDLVAEPPAVRSWNVSDIHQYIEAIEQGKIPCERELLDDDTRYNDRIATALRTSDGLDLAMLSERHRRYCMQEARRYIDDGLLRQTDNRLVLTRKGLFVSDMVMSALMLV
ncbi:MAG: radical SAM family heme chaperone HemW [Prevotella sp.]|nr:radical SAM family heme chaperone HemW [Prevotella sp.]